MEFPEVPTDPESDTGQQVQIRPFVAPTVPTSARPTSLMPLIADQRAVARLLETLLAKAGLTVGQAAKEFGVTDEAVRQYVTGRRNNPSLLWFIKFAHLCGAKVSVEFPPRGR